jgi:hypothetical protein
MIVPRDVIITIMVQLKLEFNGCKCERCSIDWQERFAELVTEYVLFEQLKERNKQ